MHFDLLARGAQPGAAAIEPAARIYRPRHTRYARTSGKSCKAGKTDEEPVVVQGRPGVEFCGVFVAAGVRSARACRKARRAGDRQQRLQERSKAAEGGQ